MCLPPYFSVLYPITLMRLAYIGGVSVVWGGGIIFDDSCYIHIPLNLIISLKNFLFTMVIALLVFFVSHAFPKILSMSSVVLFSLAFS